MKIINQAQLDNLKVLVRADLDISVENGKVTDDFRLKAILPTLNFLIKSNAQSIIIIGHLDRPEGRDPKFSLKPVAQYLERLLKTQIDFVKDINQAVIDQENRIMVLENLRYWEGESKNDPEFAQKLANLADIYVNEAFATSHREDASIVGLSKLLPAYAGLQLAKEVEQLQNFWDDSKHPICFLLGGAKTDKIDTVKKIMNKSDFTLIGGVFMFEKSLEGIKGATYPPDAVDWYDIGPKSVELFKERLNDAKTVLWNGPLGKFEDDKYANGTKEISKFLATKVYEDQIKVAVGGGNTISALRKFGVLDKMSFVSTGGGAMLELLVEGTLPGIRALEKL